jgi:hypothetical protein
MTPWSQPRTSRGKTLKKKKKKKKKKKSTPVLVLAMELVWELEQLLLPHTLLLLGRMQERVAVWWREGGREGGSGEGGTWSLHRQLLLSACLLVSACLGTL